MTFTFIATRHDRSRSLDPGARVVPGASRGVASAFLLPNQEPTFRRRANLAVGEPTSRLASARRTATNDHRHGDGSYGAGGRQRARPAAPVQPHAPRQL